MSPTPRPPARRFGFTLLELIISIAVIAILGGVVAIALNRSMDKSNYQNCVANVVILSQAMERYKQTSMFYATNLNLVKVREYGVTNKLNCPASVPPQDTYTLVTASGGYQYTIFCSGNHHQRFMGVQNVPQYSSTQQKILPEAKL